MREVSTPKTPEEVAREIVTKSFNANDQAGYLVEQMAAALQQEKQRAEKADEFRERLAGKHRELSDVSREYLASAITNLQRAEKAETQERASTSISKMSDADNESLRAQLADMTAERDRCKQEWESAWEKWNAESLARDAAHALLRECANIFRYSKLIHGAKGTLEGDRKAKDNSDIAARIETVLSGAKTEDPRDALLREAGKAITDLRDYSIHALSCQCNRTGRVKDCDCKWTDTKRQVAALLAKIRELVK